MPIVTMAATMGGNVRVGLEDRCGRGRASSLESNAQQVRMARTIIEGLGLEIATLTTPARSSSSRAATASRSNRNCGAQDDGLCEAELRSEQGYRSVHALIVYAHPDRPRSRPP